MPAVQNSTKAHLALLGANIFYGASYTLAKEIMPALILPSAFIFIRVGLTTLLFWIGFACMPASRTPVVRKDWPILILGGLTGVAFNQLLFFEGLNLTLPIHASLIMMGTPLLITVFAWVILRESITPRKSMGLLLGITGAFLLMSAGKEVTATGSSARGDLLVFLNAASYAVYLILIKPLMLRYRPVVVIRWVFLFGFLFVIPFGLPEFMTIDWSLFTWREYGIVAFIVVCVTFLTYLWNIYALQYLSPATAGAYIYLQPFFAAVISILVAGETLTPVKITASLLVFSGVFLVTRQRKVKTGS